jgi:aldehyde:ferredoxin oxidoreductase
MVLSYALIHIDLTGRKVEKECLSTELVGRFIGGYGVGCKLYYDRAKPGADPFSPGNPVIIGAGILGGTSVPSAGKIFALTKCPLPGGTEKKFFVGYGSAGSKKFGWNLKRAGYDCLMLTGRSSTPCYILIEDDRVQMCDATDLWGSKDTYETADALLDKHKGAGVITIGRAGENRVSFAMALADKIGTLGRTGIGAVLGSKNVKAVVVRGTRGVAVADRQRLTDAVKPITESIKSSPFFGPFRQWGVHAGWPGYLKALNAGIWTQEKWDRLYGFEKYAEVKRDIKVCTACAFKCKSGYSVRNGRWTGVETESGHFVLCAYAGQKLGIEDHRDAVKLLDVCNRAGMCFATATNMTDWLTGLYSRGAIGKGRTDAGVLSRDFGSYVGLLNSVAHAQGFGQTVSRGWHATSEAIGVDAREDYIGSGIVKGVDPLLDARFWGLSVSTFGYIVHPRPHHGNLHSPQYGGMIHEESVLKEDFRQTGVTETEFNRVFTPVPYYGSFSLGRMTRHIEDRGAIVQSLGVCDAYSVFGFLPLERLAECYSAVTGIETKAKELKRAGERVCNLYKLTNTREGFTRDDDQCPPAWHKPIDSPDGEAAMKDYYGTRKISRDDMKNLLNDYYDERGWDLEQGIPGKEKLSELNLEEHGIDL